MANFTAGTSFSDGVTNDVTAAKLNALVADAVPTSNLALTSTNGTISNFTSSTATITGAITGSTNVINIGSGQIYKDASGNVGIGTSSPSDILHVSKANGVSIFESTGVSSVGIRLRTNSTDRWQIGCPNASADLAIYTGTAAVERLRIDSSGNVGIGATSPSFTQGGGLHIKNSDRANLKLQDSTTNVLTEISVADNSVSSNFIVDVDPTNIGSGGCPLIIRTGGGTERLRIDSSGGVTIAGLAGTGSRAVNASAAGLLSAASDASLKEEVVGAHIAGLSEILQIHPKMYRWKDDIANRGDQASVELGFIANDVAPIIPSAAPMGNDGLYGFYDRSITAALVKAIQELKSENDSLKSRIEALESK